MNSKTLKILGMILALFGTVMGYGSYQSIQAAGMTFSILPGPLTLDYPVEQIKMTYDKETSAFYGEVGTLVVTDATGSGLGWHVDVFASPVTLTQENGNTKKLPEGSLTLHKSGAKITSNGGEFPHFFDTNYTAINTAGKPTEILTAYADEGMGQFHIDFAPESLQLHVPDYKEGDTYYATLTFSVTQGP